MDVCGARGARSGGPGASLDHQLHRRLQADDDPVAGRGAPGAAAARRIGAGRQRPRDGDGMSVSHPAPRPIESSLAALQVNVHSALDTNAKIIADWKELVDRFGAAVK